MRMMQVVISRACRVLEVTAVEGFPTACMIAAECEHC
jgi:hypothetical protein